MATADSTTMVYGVVNSDGTVQSKGSNDYTVVADTKTGIYTVTFDKAFGSKPAVLATGEFDLDDPDDVNKGRVVDTNQITTSGFQVIITNTASDRKNLAFSFLAIGQ